MNNIIKSDNPRRSNIELLRIVCMFFIILRHYANSTQLTWELTTAGEWTWHLLFLQLLAVTGLTATNCFLLISGYFMVGRDVNWKRVVSLIAEMFFYSWIIMAVIYGFGILPFSLKDMIKEFFPLWFGQNWFVVCYVILCCLLPFINPFLNSLSREAYQKMLAVIIFIWSIAYMFGATTYFNSEFSVDHFVIIYIIGGYIGRFGLKPKKGSVGLWLTALLSLLYLSVIVMSVGGALLGSDALVKKALFFDNGKNILQLAICVLLLLWALESKPFYSRWINLIAKSVVGIFLIHHNSLLLQVIWYKVSPDINYIHSDLLPLHCLIKCTVVFLGCLLIDQIRLATVDKVFNRWLDSHWDRLVGKMSKIVSWLKDRFPVS